MASIIALLLLRLNFNLTISLFFVKVFCSEGIAENKGLTGEGRCGTKIKEGTMGLRSYYLYYYYNEKERSPRATLRR
jgi:hypothetical protein